LEFNLVLGAKRHKNRTVVKFITVATLAKIDIINLVLKTANQSK